MMDTGQSLDLWSDRLETMGTKKVVQDVHKQDGLKIENVWQEQIGFARDKCAINYTIRQILVKQSFILTR